MRSTRLVPLFVTAIVALSPLTTRAFEVPPNDGFYTETIDILTDEQEAQIESVLAAYRAETSNEIAILTVDSMSGSSIMEAGVEVGRKWKVGTAENDNGILILAALQDREVTIQTGYGLEGAVPDIVAAGIIERDIVPHFQEAEYAEGYLAAIDALKKHIGGEYTASRYEESSIGGFLQFLFILILIGGNFFAAVLGHSKSWWAGGVIGGVIGIVLTVLYSWWIAIPFFVILGLIFDYIVSRHPPRYGRGGRWGGGGGFGGFGGGSGGGFGGFGGGSFGGGGARGRW